jgi:phosphopantothenate synthetase
MFGKKHREETKLIIKEKKLQLISDETRDKMSIIAKQRLEEYNYWLGRKHTDESRNKMRITAANRIHNNKWHPSFNITACEII